MLPLACLDGDLKSGASMADSILIMGLKPLADQQPESPWFFFGRV
jgi:hypothetical protein